MGDMLGAESPHGNLPGAWIEPRGLLNHRKWSPASMAALHVAREAVAASGWSKEELEDAALVVGTSRGNAAGWLGPWPERRPFKLMAASNTIHSEPATAISIELGIFGPNHVLASGCSAGLDALGVGKMMIDSGLVERALVVAVDLPLVPLLLDNYANSGLLAKSMRLNPFSADTGGFIPGEGAAAIALSSVEEGVLRLEYFANNSDGADPVGVPKNGGRTMRLLKKAVEICGKPGAICPHATGTAIQARSERMFYSQENFPEGGTMHLLKPFIGHTVGASGLLESAILLRFMSDSKLPPNLEGTVGTGGWNVFSEAIPCVGPVFKLAHGMGGHNAVAVFETTS
ncbi:beta-ketoacyl synthase N-terminal-like domain-containing protein [Luteolibacter sp. AS25]|uniref:beta-ketoacyl synthase N-terminal-like domain-containing protein n=1 Tax=Luteolibacter sp. AS25 TaxID=3135776 RepID=UPI00398B99CF